MKTNLAVIQKQHYTQNQCKCKAYNSTLTKKTAGILQEYYAVCLQDFQLIFLKEFLQEFYEGNNYMQELCPTGITIRSI